MTHSGNVVSVTDKNEDVTKDAETALSNQQVGSQEEICSENDSPLCSENTKRIHMYRLSILRLDSFLLLYLHQLFVFF